MKLKQIPGNIDIFIRKNMRNCIGYVFKLMFLLTVVIFCRYFFLKLGEHFYDYNSYIYSIGLLLIVLLPNLHEFSFWGIRAKGKDNSGDMEGYNYKSETINNIKDIYDKQTN